MITNALRHEGQLIVIDIKGEVYAATAQRRREMEQEVYVLDLRDGGMAGSLNPLDLALRTGTDIAAVARGLAGEMVERTGEERDRFWTDWGETMLAGGMAWLLANQPAEERRLSRLFDLYNTHDSDYQIAMVLDRRDPPVNRATQAAWGAFLQLSERETKPSVMATAQTYLRLFDSELTRNVTDTTTVDIDGLIAGKPMSLYIIVPPYRLTAYRPLLRMWLSGLLLALTTRKEPPKNRTLMLCDEIGNLGRIDAFLMAATLMRSSGLTVWSFWQNADQLQIYKPQAHTLVDNAGVVQVFGARNRRAASEFASMIGSVDPDTVLNLGSREQLLLIEGGTPVRCAQARYYDDEAFREFAR